MSRLQTTGIEGESAYSLSLKVAQLRCITGVDKAVLRALCDHYPTIWVSVPKLADESGWCERSTQDALRRVESDNWICPTEDRIGGTGNSGQYVVNDRKILNAFASQQREDAICKRLRKETCRCTVKAEKCAYRLDDGPNPKKANGAPNAPFNTDNGAADAPLLSDNGAADAPGDAANAPLTVQQIPEGCSRFQKGASLASKGAPNACEPIISLSGSQSENRSFEPTSQPTTGMAGRSVNLPETPTPKTADKNTNLVLEDLQMVWEKCEAEPIALPRRGWESLQENLQAANLLARVSDLKDAFETWLYDRYTSSYDNELTRLHSPLALFAQEFMLYVSKVEKNKAAVAERNAARIKLPKIVTPQATHSPEPPCELALHRRGLFHEACHEHTR